MDETRRRPIRVVVSTTARPTGRPPRLCAREATSSAFRSTWASAGRCRPVPVRARPRFRPGCRSTATASDRASSRLIEPIVQGVTDMTVGTRFAKLELPTAFGGGSGSSCCLARQPARAATGDRYDSGFRAVNRKGPALARTTRRLSGGGDDRLGVPPQAADAGGPVEMRTAPAEGRRSRSSDRLLRDKGLAALFIGLFRRYSTPGE